MESDGQLELLAAPATPSARRVQRSKRTASNQVPADTKPIASVLVDSGLAHVDRPFDYLVPAKLDSRVVPGGRVRVRFAGKLVDGFVVDRRESTDFTGKLSFVSGAPSAELVLAPDVLALARAVAQRYAGSVSDVLRLAIPPRHAAAERETSPPRRSTAQPERATWADYESGPDFIEALARGVAARAVWSALPRPEPAIAVAHAVLAAVQAGHGVIVCVPDGRDLAHFEQQFRAILGDGFVILSGAQTPADRYAAFLAVARGACGVVLGTRAAAFAPVRDLGLLVVWDDGDDSYSDPRAPYPHAREVMLTRAEQLGCGLLLASHARSAEAQSLVDSGWCTNIVPPQAVRRDSWPRLETTDGSDSGGARLPRRVFSLIRAAAGPVLVQVPRRGYRTALACQRCRTSARCRACEGPLVQEAANAAPSCRWCAAVEQTWACRACSGHHLRSPVVGQLRTAEEMAQAFADFTVVTSGGGSVLDEVQAGKTLVLSTPGAEPRVPGGYALIVLLDTWLMLARDDVRVAEEAHRRWFNSMALAAPGASAIAVGESTVLQALVRADPVGAAQRELADRRAARMPPVSRMVSIEGERGTVTMLAERQWTVNTEVLGPSQIEPNRPDRVRLVLRAPRRQGAELVAMLRSVATQRSQHKLASVRIQVDPLRF